MRRMPVPRRERPLAKRGWTGDVCRSFFQITGTMRLIAVSRKITESLYFGGVLDSTLGWSVWLPFAGEGPAQIFLQKQ
jgi:hypothetical protein